MCVWGGGVDSGAGGHVKNCFSSVTECWEGAEPILAEVPGPDPPTVLSLAMRKTNNDLPDGEMLSFN